MQDIMKCMNAAVESYVRNTQGEEAAKRTLSPAVTQRVMGAMAADITSPAFDVNATCS